MILNLIVKEDCSHVQKVKVRKVHLNSFKSEEDVFLEKFSVF